MRICVEQKAPDLSATAVFAGFFSTVTLSDFSKGCIEKFIYH